MRCAISLVFNSQHGTYANISRYAGPGNLPNQTGYNPSNSVPGYQGGVSIADTGNEENARQIAGVITAYITANPDLTINSDLRPLEAQVRKVMDFRAPYANVFTQHSPEVQAQMDEMFAMMEVQDVEIDEGDDSDSVWTSME